MSATAVRTGSPAPRCAPMRDLGPSDEDPLPGKEPCPPLGGREVQSPDSVPQPIRAGNLLLFPSNTCLEIQPITLGTHLGEMGGWGGLGDSMFLKILDSYIFFAL